MSKEVWSPERYRSYKPKKKAKYHNRKVVVDGTEFDSQKEADRYGELVVLQKAGLISLLVLQESFVVYLNGVKICEYIADFVYYDDKGKRVVEDVKGMRTPVYKLKKKLVEAAYGVTITEK